MSSGGHLIASAAMVDGSGDPDDPDPVNRERAALQCVVLYASPLDLLRIEDRTGEIALLLGSPVTQSASPSSPEHRAARDASPMSHVSRGDPPVLLIHGDADLTVPFEQSELMERTLRDAGIPVKLIRIPGGDHLNAFPVSGPEANEPASWFDAHLVPSR